MSSIRGEAGVGLLDRPTIATVTELLDQVDAALQRLGRGPVDITLDDLDVLEITGRLQRMENRLHAQKLRWLAEVMERRAYQGAAARSPEQWLTRFGLTRPEAVAQVASTQVLIALPDTAQRAHAGDLGPGHLQTAARTLARLPDLAEAATGPAGADGQTANQAGDDAGGGAGEDGPQPAAGGEGHDDVAGADGDGGGLWDPEPLIDPYLEELDRARRDLDALISGQADGTDRAALGRELDRFEHDRGGDRLDERDRGARARRKAWLGVQDGMKRLTVDLPLADAQRVEANLRRLARRDGPDDPRRYEQRMADAAYRLLTQELPATVDPDGPDAAMAAMPGPGAQVLIVTTLDPTTPDGDGEASIDGLGLIPSETLRLECCDAEITDVWVDIAGNPVHLGRTRRTVTDRQRKVLIVRDRGCVGCGADVSRCQAHHVHWWEHGGRTDTCSMCLLCWDCHHNVHHSGWIIYRLPGGGYRARPPGEPPPPGAVAVDPHARQHSRR
jgi:hypothetical protein